MSASTAAKESPLCVASRRGHTGIVAELLAAGASVNAADEVGETPLHKAAEYGHEPTLKALLAAGADPSLAAGHGGTALDAAVAGASSKQGVGGDGAANRGGDWKACATLLRARAGKRGTTTL